MLTERTARPLPIYPVPIHRVAVILALLLGFALRSAALGDHGFHEDEALYSYWALYGWYIDPLFLEVWPDKPPLYPALLAAIYGSVGSEPALAQWFNIALSTITIALVAEIGRRLHSPIAGALSAFCLCLNPLAISFAPTAFTDPLLVMSGIGALLAALMRKPLWAGLWLGIAVAGKQQGVLFMPLIAAALAISVYTRRQNSKSSHSIRSALSYWAIGLLFASAPVLLWDSLRWDVAPSPWDLATRNYAPLQLVPLSTVLSRLDGWTQLLWYLTSSTVVWLLLGAGACLSLLRWAMQWVDLSAADRFRLVNPGKNPHTVPTGGRAAGFLSCLEVPLLVSGTAYSRPTGLGSLGSMEIQKWVLLFWTFGFLILHILTTVQLWDRYLLPLAPILSLFCSLIGATILTSHRAGRTQIVAVALTMLLMLPPAFQAARGRLPLGGDHGTYSGLPTAIAWLKQHMAEEFILYHQVLGRHYNFYLFDEIQGGTIEPRWFSTGTYLADNVEKSPRRRKIIVLPNWAPQPDLTARLNMRGFVLREQLRSGNFTLFEIAAKQTQGCVWCFCGSAPLWTVDDSLNRSSMLSKAEPIQHYSVTMN